MINAPVEIITKTSAVDANGAASLVLRRMARALRRQPISVREFYEQAWPIIEPSHPLVPSWHLDLILEYLTAVDMGQIKRLAINIPPRSLKSSTVSVIWPVWSWTEKPWLRWVFSSYSLSLSIKHSIDRRRIVESPWFTRNWGDVCKLEEDQNQKAEYQTTLRGTMIATSVGGSITGKGGDRLVIDDLINPLEAESEVVRQTAIDFYQKTLSTRLDDKKLGSIIIVEQRTHRADLTGTVLKEDGWTHLSVPAEAPSYTVVKFPLSGREIIRPEGSVICEEREDKETLTKQRQVMGSRAYAAQFQQSPTDEESGYFKPAWWKYYKMLPVSDIIREWSWDTAMEEGQENDESVGILFAHLAHGTFVEKVVRGRWQYPELKRVVLNEFAAEPARSLLIEDSVAGKSLAQDLARNSNLPVLPVKVAGDKVFRASLCSPYVESGRVFLPEGAPWLVGFIDQLSAFPMAEHDDVVDAFSQGMNHYYLGPTKPVSALSNQMLASGPSRPSWL